MIDAEREQRNQEATVHVGNLDSLTTEELLYELFSQAGPVERVHIPRDKVTGENSGFGFVEFCLERDAEYAARLLNGVKLYNRAIRVNKATTTARALDIGANLFIGDLDEQVDETMLTEVFSAFGQLIKPPQIARDLTTGKSLGYGFLSYDNFNSSDSAIANMNEQFLFNRQIRVMYAYKKGTQERHGSETERLLAQNSSGVTGSNVMPVGGIIKPPPPPPSLLLSGMMPPPPPLSQFSGYPPITPLIPRLI